MYTWSLYFHGSVFTESFFGNKDSMMEKRTESSWKLFLATRKLSPRLSGDSCPGFQQVHQLWNILFLSVDPLGVNIAVLSCSITFFKWKIESMDCDILSHVKKKRFTSQKSRDKMFSGMRHSLYERWACRTVTCLPRKMWDSCPFTD